MNGQGEMFQNKETHDYNNCSKDFVREHINLNYGQLAC